MSDSKRNFRAVGVAGLALAVLSAGCAGPGSPKSSSSAPIEAARQAWEKTKAERKAWQKELERKRREEVAQKAGKRLAQQRKADAQRKAEETRKAKETLEAKRKAEAETRKAEQARQIQVQAEAKRQEQLHKERLEEARKADETRLRAQQQEEEEAQRQALQIAQDIQQEKKPTRRVLRKRILAARDIPNDLYRAQPGDELEIVVWSQADLNRKVLVREDGAFPFPVVGTIRASGRTLREIEQAILEVLTSRAIKPGEEGIFPMVPRDVVSPSEIPEEPYRLQAGDRIEISVWGQPDLNRTAQIREDGFSPFPLIGSVQAAGRPLKEIEQEVQERLNRDFLVNPQVTARLAEAKISVLGDVKTPGSYILEGPLDLMAAITQAGGVTQLGPVKADVIRKQGDETLVIRAYPDAILLGKQPNVPLAPHDTVSVRVLPSFDEAEDSEVTVRLTAAKFSMLGDIQRPGTYALEGNSTDLLTAISQAGGVTKFGSSRVDIIRERGNEQLTIRAHLGRILQGKDPNITILPRDTIYVRRRLF